jgi:NAD+ kinase
MAPPADEHSTQRRILVVPHSGRADAIEITATAVDGLRAAGIEVCLLAEAAEKLNHPDVRVVSIDDAAKGCELTMVFGGDGTILRAAYLSSAYDVPLLGVNLGHMGFLAESEPDGLAAVLTAAIDRDYQVESRMALEVVVRTPQGTCTTGWALNDVTLEKTERGRMVELVLAIDDEPLSSWAADGIVCSTPTGSTAYAWSAGGPVVWPEVEALVVVPISAHALFSRPLVVSPRSEIDIELLAQSSPALAWCDGSRQIEVPPGSRLEVRRSTASVKLARLHDSRFARRLVAKFNLPVEGWRGRDKFAGPTT